MLIVGYCQHNFKNVDMAKSLKDRLIWKGYKLRVKVMSLEKAGKECPGESQS
jgi:hypothetical protein